MDFLYNIADVQVNIASNEGFGLGTAEAVMAGTPIIVNVTGGLQDQCGFELNGKHVGYEDYREIVSFHDKDKWEHNADLTWGEWVKPVWPKTRSLMGSVPTPYIFDDRCRFDDAADRIKEWYDETPERRQECGELGRELCLRDDVGFSPYKNPYLLQILHSYFLQKIQHLLSNKILYQVHHTLVFVLVFHHTIL
jgi:glycosyltransferase involved in cell wall biosynthesis